MRHKKIKVKVVEPAIMYNHDLSEVISETFDEEVFVAEFNEDYGEYYGRDSKGRELLVAIVGWSDEIVVEDGFILL